jgi:two-component system sensor histidine kinase ChvG
MASATDIARAERGEGPDPVPFGRQLIRFGGSRLGGLILALNLLSLLILFGGALLLNEWRTGLIDARQESLMGQAELLARVLSDKDYTRGEPVPELDPTQSAKVLIDRFVPAGQRARIFDRDGVLIADSFDVSDTIEGQPLPPALPAGTPEPPVGDADRIASDYAQASAALGEEIEAALAGAPQANVRRSETGDRVVSVSLPIRHVQQVLGVLTLEANDVDEILDAQRRALMPFALVALAVNLLASLLLHLFVARPVMRLSAAADEVKRGRARAISLPDLEDRRDEIGDLARSLESMTATLSARMDAIERFAADVAHEIKNPLTSIRSALETLDLVKEKSQRDRLTMLLQQDVRRLDRLITDISNASRLDAELSRDRPRPVDLGALLTDIVGVYETTARPGAPSVTLDLAVEGPAWVMGRDGPLGQVFRNLIDNARSFSPADRSVRISLQRDETGSLPLRIHVDDDGPGIPPENLETVFDRFYTARPSGTAFGANSGLGLSIVRQIVAAHGGRVTATNRLDPGGRIEGARFEVALPAFNRRP